MNSQIPPKHIFWYIVGVTAFTFLYVILITFVEIPEKAIRFADTILGFLLGTAVGSGINYLIGGTALASVKKQDPPTGTTTAEVTATITTEPTEKKDDDISRK